MKRQWFPLWIFPILFVLAMATVWVRLSMIQTNYQVHQMDQTIRNVRLERSKLSMELSQLRSPQELKKTAAKKFSYLHRPKNHQVINLK